MYLLVLEYVCVYLFYDGEGDMKKCLLEKIFFLLIVLNEVNLIFCEE